MLLLIMALAAASPGQGKTMGVDDWHQFTIQKVAFDPGGSPLYLRVAGGDSDGDGLGDEAVLKLTCSAGAVTDARYQPVSPRDTVSGQPSGKRMHQPMKIIKEWDAASAQLAAMKPTYDVKTMKGARAAADADGWSPITLGTTDGLCAAASAGRATKTRSNIQNN
jgi:hypothetical protein